MSGRLNLLGTQSGLTSQQTKNISGTMTMSDQGGEAVIPVTIGNQPVNIPDVSNDMSFAAAIIWISQPLNTNITLKGITGDTGLPIYLANGAVPYAVIPLTAGQTVFYLEFSATVAEAIVVVQFV